MNPKKELITMGPMGRDVRVWGRTFKRPIAGLKVHRPEAADQIAKLQAGSLWLPKKG